MLTENTTTTFDQTNILGYMFDLPKSDNPRILLSNYLLRLKEIRHVFFNTNLENLEDFSVMWNIHADWCLGTYLIHKDWINLLIETGDFNLAFYIKEYNKEKQVKRLTNNVNWLEQLERFSNNTFWKSTYSFYKENAKFLELKTKWTVVICNSKPIALISEYDATRLVDLIKHNHSELTVTKTTVSSIEEGLELLSGK